MKPLAILLLLAVPLLAQPFGLEFRLVDSKAAGETFADADAYLGGWTMGAGPPEKDSWPTIGGFASLYSPGFTSKYLASTSTVNGAGDYYAKARSRINMYWTDFAEQQGPKFLRAAYIKMDMLECRFGHAWTEVDGITTDTDSSYGGVMEATFQLDDPNAAVDTNTVITQLACKHIFTKVHGSQHAYDYSDTRYAGIANQAGEVQFVTCTALPQGGYACVRKRRLQNGQWEQPGPGETNAGDNKIWWTVPGHTVNLDFNAHLEIGASGSQFTTYIKCSSDDNPPEDEGYRLTQRMTVAATTDYEGEDDIKAKTESEVKAVVLLVTP